MEVTGPQKIAMTSKVSGARRTTSEMGCISPSVILQRERNVTPSVGELGRSSSEPGARRDALFTLLSEFLQVLGCGTYREAHVNMSQETAESKYSHMALFRARLEEKYDTSTYQKRDLLWLKAWDLGHRDGLEEIELWYESLVEILP